MTTTPINWSSPNARITSRKTAQRFGDPAREVGDG